KRSETIHGAELIRAAVPSECEPMNQLEIPPREVVRALQARAFDADSALAWPADSWQALQRGGVLGWSIPVEYGGLALSTHELLHGYECLAGACLTTTFLLSQREAAVRRLLDGQ